MHKCSTSNISLRGLSLGLIMSTNSAYDGMNLDCSLTVSIASTTRSAGYLLRFRAIALSLALAA